MDAGDLVKVARLLELTASTTRCFSVTSLFGNGDTSRIAELSRQIEVIASELAQIAEEGERKPL